MKSYLIMREIFGSIILSIFLGVGFYFAKDKMNLENYMLILVIATIFVTSTFSALLNFKNWQYSYDDENIIYREGFITIKTTIIPVVRVQQIVTISNPILEKKGLVILNIITTTATHELLPILKEEGEKTTNFITSALADRIKREDIIKEKLEEKLEDMKVDKEIIGVTDEI